MLHSGNRLDLTGEDDKIFSLYIAHGIQLNIELSMSNITKRISSISNLRKPIGVYRYVRSVCLLCKLGRLKINFILAVHQSFWKFLRQINAYMSNKCPLKLPCAYLNAQESRPPGTIGKERVGVD
ncbi:hypothetical protein T07_9400 [Trichinella nelsoni]|uniref:Uncharacterized protein n=1 Tax=Trichinella nelsoni TaxID=6336 RepID=A0A0V0RXA1_9BILA|nr:hypothetical protein T07_9400 [Trichinella nelsoni]